MNNLQHNPCIIVYSLQWGETYAIEGLYTQLLPHVRIMICFTPAELIDLLSKYRTASVILGILPHESVFLLSRIGPYLQKRPILLFGQKFNYADRTIPAFFSINDIKFCEWKSKKIIQISKVLSDFAMIKSINHDANCPVPIISTVLHADDLIYRLNLYLYQQLSRHRVGEYSAKVLCMLSCGFTIKEIEKLLCIHAKSLSAHKYRGLSLLGIETSSYNIFRGFFIKAALQKYNMYQFDMSAL